MGTPPQATEGAAEALRLPRARGCGLVAGRLLLFLVIVLAASIFIGLVYQAVTAGAERRSFPPPGQLVDVGGFRMHVHCLGEGSPTVILEGGAGSASPMWGWIQPDVAGTTRVCSYDRAGFGWSDSGPEPRDGQHIVDELHTLLTNAGIRPPFVLAGHSFGGELIRLYAHQYPNEVVGMVLIDSSHPDQFERSPALQEELAFGRRLNRAAALTATLGLMRLYWGEAGPNPELPSLQRAEMRAFFATSRPYRTDLAEGQARATTDAQVRATAALPGLPVIVVTTSAGGLWRTLQDELAGLSSNCRMVVVEGATHTGLLTNPQHAHQTGDAIKQVMLAIRSGLRLDE